MSPGQAGKERACGLEACVFRLSSSEVCFFRCGQFTEAKVIETLEKLKELADTAWKEFPESVPVQNAFGELVETIYVIGHTIGSFLLLMVQFLVVKNYVVPFAKKIYHFVVDDYEEFKQWQATKHQKGEDKND